MTDTGMITTVTFVMGTSLVLFLYLTLSGRRSRLDMRLEQLTDKEPVPALDSVRQMAMRTLPRMGHALMPNNEEERTDLQARLIHAGYYSRQALLIFLGTKLVMMMGPPLVGFLLFLAGLLPLASVMVGSIFFAVAGMVAPSFWLDSRKRRRQRIIRRAMPDALDVIVICLEGGLSLQSALRRVGGELRGAHPLLAQELNIVQREIHLGQTPGTALQHLADRADLEELRSLASVINQSERFGASLVKALRTHADTLRGKRLQYAEEMAQKAAIKILFPTIFCIMPGLFLVILGPAVMQVIATLSKLRGHQ